MFYFFLLKENIFLEQMRNKHLTACSCNNMDYNIPVKKFMTLNVMDLIPMACLVDCNRRCNVIVISIV